MVLRLFLLLLRVLVAVASPIVSTQQGRLCFPLHISLSISVCAYYHHYRLPRLDLICITTRRLHLTRRIHSFALVWTQLRDSHSPCALQTKDPRPRVALVDNEPSAPGSIDTTLLRVVPFLPLRKRAGTKTTAPAQHQHSQQHLTHARLSHHDPRDPPPHRTVCLCILGRASPSRLRARPRPFPTTQTTARVTRPPPGSCAERANDRCPGSATRNDDDGLASDHCQSGYHAFGPVANDPSLLEPNRIAPHRDGDDNRYDNSDDDDETARYDQQH